MDVNATHCMRGDDHTFLGQDPRTACAVSASVCSLLRLSAEKSAAGNAVGHRRSAPLRRKPHSLPLSDDRAQRPSPAQSSSLLCLPCSGKADEKAVCFERCLRLSACERMSVRLSSRCEKRRFALQAGRHRPRTGRAGGLLLQQCQPRLRPFCRGRTLFRRGAGRRDFVCLSACLGTAVRDFSRPRKEKRL